MPFYTSTPPRTTPPAWTPPPAGATFMTGATPSTRRALLSAVPFRPYAAPPPQFAVVPAKLDMWGNNQYGCCVSTEEAFAKACHNPEIFIPTQTVTDWASKHGVLNGAMLDEVLDWMVQGGFQIGAQLYNDGRKQGVDYETIDVLKAAIATGPVKLGMSSGCLPSGAGNQQGWYAFGNKGNHQEDHCTALSGYGTAGYCFSQLGVALPSGVDPNKPDCFLHFTWSTIGVVDFDWIRGAVGEAWLRDPTTVGVPPLPDSPLDWYA